MTSKHSPLINDTKATVEMAHQFWRHYYSIFHVQQVNSAKNYLWLAVTVITALFALYTQGLIITLMESVLFHISFVLSVLCILIGISCLSSGWFYGKEPLEPIAQAGIYINNLENFGKNSEERYLDLKELVGYYDEAIVIIQARIAKRGQRLRLMSWTICGAITAGAFLVVLTL